MAKTKLPSPILWASRNIDKTTEVHIWLHEPSDYNGCYMSYAGSHIMVLDIKEWVKLSKTKIRRGDRISFKIEITGAIQRGKFKD